MTQKKSKKRLDLLLVEQGHADSLHTAQALVLAGLVEIISHSSSRKYSKNQIKSGLLLPQDTLFRVGTPSRFVSRGGEKLDSALQKWKPNLEGRVCFDIGVSTGGFTDCLLQKGARLVYAVDVGYGHTHPKIRAHPQVRLFEKSHIARWTPPWARTQEDVPTLLTIDLSFISLKKVLEPILELVNLGNQLRKKYSQDLEIFALLKPQFEVLPKDTVKGVVKDPKARKMAIEEVKKFIGDLQFDVIDQYSCPVEGRQGNIEEWLYVKPNVCYI